MTKKIYTAYESKAMGAAKKAAASAGSIAALVGAAAGFAAVLFSPKYGRELKSELNSAAEIIKAQIAAEVTLQVSQAKTMSKAIYDEVVRQAMAEYAKSSNLAEKDMREIEKDVNQRWRHIMKIAKKSSRAAYGK